MAVLDLSVSRLLSDAEIAGLKKTLDAFFEDAPAGKLDFLFAGDGEGESAQGVVRGWPPSD